MAADHIANVTPVTDEHVARVKQELRDAGVTTLGMLKFASRYVPSILHKNEHVKGAVYGRYAAGTGLLKWTEGMLVATERRVIFLDRKPGFASMDEITYDVVSGVKKTYAWPFSSIMLHTRIGNYNLRFANPRCINIFTTYVEQRRVESSLDNNARGERTDDRAAHYQAAIGEQELAFLHAHDTGVLSTVDVAGNVHGAAVHYFVVDGRYVGILTKAGTDKARDVLVRRPVAFTVYDEPALQTLQLEGVAEVETDPVIKDRALAVLGKPRIYGGRLRQRPVTKLPQEGYVVIRIVPQAVRLSGFGKLETGEE